MAARFKPSVTVAVIVEQDGRYLMVEEFNEEQGHRRVFGMPAGHVEARETVTAAACREVREETGLDVTLTGVSGVYVYVKDAETILRFCFTAVPCRPGSALRPHDPDHEIAAARWYDRETVYRRRDEWRTRLVGRCMDDYLAGRRWPVSMLDEFSTVGQGAAS